VNSETQFAAPGLFTLVLTFTILNSVYSNVKLEGESWRRSLCLFKMADFNQIITMAPPMKEFKLMGVVPVSER